MPSNAQCILFVDHNKNVRDTAQQAFARAAIKTKTCATAPAFLAHIKDDWPGIVIVALPAPGMDAVGFVSAIQKIDREIPVILVTSQEHAANISRGMRDSIYEVITTPDDDDHLIATTRHAIDHRRLILENRALRTELTRYTKTASGFIGHSAAVKKLRTFVHNIANSPAHVLITAEPGSDKASIARNLHELSGRTGSFVAVNCAEFPERFLETELFGDTTANDAGGKGLRTGKIEQARGGTLFLNDIDCMPLAVQVRLLGILQHRDTGYLPSNTGALMGLRIVAATTIDLRAASARGAFREDLYYRLNAAQLHIPPLRDRKDDIAVLFDHFCREAANRLDRGVTPVKSADLKRLHAHDWPGNVKELRAAAERYVLGLDPLINLPDEGRAPALSLPRQVEAFEKGLITDALREHEGNVTATVKALGVPRKTFYDKLAKYGITPASFRRPRK